MILNWNHVDIHLILHESRFYSIVFLVCFIPALFIKCVQRGGATPNAAGDKKIATTTQSTGPVPETAAIAQDSLMAKPISPDDGQKSKRGKGEMMDSIKVIRGRKIFRKTTQKKDKKEETDSQHTQLIDVPLGKASGHVF
ncbi:hypothetical protein GCK72_014729 [Caenorhabditis remanei]|uniref:Uncharacterized protein n=1 Tax=Caenorhabditis remanei TaxID=31234 RepID=A0A6A5GUK3_CAERE|nr:hypothetical protein GCK72_014729 [Caenorhabditis remanei]KAF1758271.1 hypothetical protein GCK72_014729 [Caenorhabditis remanei]